MLRARATGVLVAVLSIGCSGSSAESSEEETVEVNPYLDRVPQFPAPPAPEDIVLPDAEEGKAPVVHRVPTSQPVAFITVDDGVVKHPEARALLEAAAVPATLFILSPEAEEDPDYFRELVDVGSTVQAHSVTHISLEGEPAEVQRAEICDSADHLQDLIGVEPTLFRPPYGAYDGTTQEMAAECGMAAVVHWRVTVDYGTIEFQPGEEEVQPGDIILLHFRSTFVEDFLTTVDAIAQAGLTPARLEDYLP